MPIVPGRAGITAITKTMRNGGLLRVIPALLLWAASLRAADPGVTEQSFNVSFREPFFLDHHGGPAVRMVVRNADVAFVDANWTDELNRGWNVHTAKQSSVSGREGNLTLLFRHPQTGFEVYFFNTLASPQGQATIVTRAPKK